MNAIDSPEVQDTPNDTANMGVELTEAELEQIAGGFEDKMLAGLSINIIIST